jgi:hypothetical protein
MQSEQYFLQKYVSGIISKEPIPTDKMFLAYFVIIHNAICGSSQFVYRLISRTNSEGIRTEDLMNLVQVLHKRQITSPEQQRILINLLENLPQDRFMFSTIDKTKLAAILTNAQSYVLAREIQLVKEKSKLSVDEDANSFLPKCRLTIWNLYDTLHLGNYPKEFMRAAIIELIINELERLFCLHLHRSNRSTDEQIKQALMNKLGLSSEDEITKVTRLIKLLVAIRNAFVKVLYLTYYRKTKMMQSEILRRIGRGRSYRGLDELETEIIMLKRDFDNSSEISLFLPKRSRKRFNAEVKIVLAAAEGCKNRSKIYFEDERNYIRNQLIILAEHQTSDQFGFMQSYHVIRELVKFRIDRLDILFDEDIARLREEYQDFGSQLRPIYDAMTRFIPVGRELLEIRSFREVIKGTSISEESLNRKVSCAFGALKRVREPKLDVLQQNVLQQIDVLQTIGELREAFNDFFREHDASQFQLLSDDREDLERFMIEFNDAHESLETKLTLSYGQTFESMFKEKLLAESTSLRPDIDESTYKFILKRFVLYIYNVASVAEEIRLHSPEQFILIREMVVRCLEYLVVEFSKCNSDFIEISNNADVLRSDANNAYEIIIYLERINKTFLLQDSIIVECLITPHLLIIRQEMNYIISKKLLKVFGDVDDVRSLPEDMYYQLDKSFECYGHSGIQSCFMIANRHSEFTGRNELEILYRDSEEKYREADLMLGDITQRDFEWGIIGKLIKWSTYIIPICFLGLLAVYFIAFPVFYAVSGHASSFVLEQLTRIYTPIYVRVMLSILAAFSFISIMWRYICYNTYEAPLNRSFGVANEAFNKLKRSMIEIVDAVEPLASQHDLDFFQREDSQQDDSISLESR